MIVSVAQTPTITASSAYASGNAIGGLLTFAGVSGKCKILSVNIIDAADQKAAMDLVLFKATFTPTTDKSAISISDADALNFAAGVSIVAGDYIDIGAGAVASKSLGFLAHTNASGTNLYGQLISRGTPTYGATSDLKVVLTVELLV